MSNIETVNNCKLIGIEKVNYQNFRGDTISGARLSFAVELPESEMNFGVRVIYQWVSSEKLPKDILLGKYYNLEFEKKFNNQTNNSYNQFYRMYDSPFVKEFKIEG